MSRREVGKCKHVWVGPFDGGAYSYCSKCMADERNADTSVPTDQPKFDTPESVLDFFGIPEESASGFWYAGRHDAAAYLAECVRLRQEWDANDGNSPGFNREKARTYGGLASQYKAVLRMVETLSRNVLDDSARDTAAAGEPTKDPTLQERLLNLARRVAQNPATAGLSEDIHDLSIRASALEASLPTRLNQDNAMLREACDDWRRRYATPCWHCDKNNSYARCTCMDQAQNLQDALAEVLPAYIWRWP